MKTPESSPERGRASGSAGADAGAAAGESPAAFPRHSSERVPPQAPGPREGRPRCDFRRNDPSLAAERATQTPHVGSHDKKPVSHDGAVSHEARGCWSPSSGPEQEVSARPSAGQAVGAFRGSEQEESEHLSPPSVFTASPRCASRRALPQRLTAAQRLLVPADHCRSTAGACTHLSVL